MIEKILFILFGVFAVGGALGTITRSNVVHGLITLIFTFVNVAAIFLLSHAYFLAVIQVLVYAILVLFTFVVMFLNLKEFSESEQLYKSQKWLVLVLAPLMLAEFVFVSLGATWSATHGPATVEAIAAAGGNVRALGQVLFDDMLLPFEIASLILLVGMVGAVVLAKKEEGDLQIREWTEEEEEPMRELIEQEV